MFHVKDGLFFGRSGDGSVRIVKNDGRHQPDEEGSVTTLDVDINADSWASVISSVSAGGEEDNRWYLARDFHSSKGRAKLVEEKTTPDNSAMPKLPTVGECYKVIPLPEDERECAMFVAGIGECHKFICRQLST